MGKVLLYTLNADQFKKKYLRRNTLSEQTYEMGQNCARPLRPHVKNIVFVLN